MFINNGHLKISPTCIESGSGVTLSLCQSFTLSFVDNKLSNDSAAFHQVGPHFFHPLWQKSISQKIFLSQWPVGQGAQKTVIWQAIAVISQDKGLKIEKQLQFFFKYFKNKTDIDMFQDFCKTWAFIKHYLVDFNSDFLENYKY